MVWQAMGGRWWNYGMQLTCFVLSIFVLVQGCFSLNSEGLALLEFQAHVYYDPYGAFTNWNATDEDPCSWFGVHCVNGKVHILDLNGLSLQGELAPEIGNLTYLRILVLSQNHLSGSIPKELGGLTMLEEVDLRDNNFNGTIPAELGGMQSLKRLLLCNNSFEGSIPLELLKLTLLSELQFDENLTSAVAGGIGCLNRKFGHCIWQNNIKAPKKADSFMVPIKGTLARYFSLFPLLNFGKDVSESHADSCCDNVRSLSESEMVQNVQSLVKVVRRKLAEQSTNLAAAPAGGGSPTDYIIALPSSRSSGSFPAVPKEKAESPPETEPDKPPKEGAHNTSNPNGSSTNTLIDNQASGNQGSNKWKYIVGISIGGFLLITAVVILFICRSRAATNIGPWRTGLSGQLQKAFITGVPKLNRNELETACEDFSNIIETKDSCILYKGTLSSGVEIAVVATTITSLKDWSKRSEMAYRKKIDRLSRVNHKNFVNLIGYCEEDEPFVRMMVFEYAPNGTLSEHLHVKELEHLDWNARTRVIMGTAYCLQHMHELKPPVALSHLNATGIYLTDDYAAKVADIDFWKEFIAKVRTPGENESEHSELPPLADAETNVYSFGILLLEIISGKLPYSEEHGPVVTWAAEYLNDKRSITNMIDPSLRSFKDNELAVICEVIQDCIQQDARKRPTMREVISKLREVLDISPEAATPRLSPLWWAELEILSAEAN